MEIKEFYTADNQEHWLAQIKNSDWGAGQFLYTLLSENRLKELCGESTKVYLLTDDHNLVSFCALEELDDVRDTDLGPWIGFVYTFPRYRGHRHMGDSLESCL